MFNGCFVVSHVYTFNSVFCFIGGDVMPVADCKYCTKFLQNNKKKILQTTTKQFNWNYNVCKTMNKHTLGIGQRSVEMILVKNIFYYYFYVFFLEYLLNY